MASAIGAALGSVFLHELADGRLSGIGHLTTLSILLTLLLPPLLSRIYRLGELH